MVDLTNYQTGSSLNMILSDDITDCLVTVVVKDVEWSHHREPFLINLKIDKTSDEENYPLGSIMRLEVILNENKEIRFLLKSPIRLDPNRIFRKKAFIKLC